jgi:hypothetical protein
LLGDPDEQHGIKPHSLLRAGIDALAALGAGANPGHRLFWSGFTARQPAQSTGDDAGISVTQIDVVDHRTGVETGPAFRAQRGKLWAGLHQESFGGFGARWGKPGHSAGKMRSLGFSVKVAHPVISLRRQTTTDFRHGHFRPSLQSLPNI